MSTTMACSIPGKRGFSSVCTTSKIGPNPSVATLTGTFEGVPISATASVNFVGNAPNKDREGVGLVKLVAGFNANDAATAPSLPIGSIVTFTYKVSNIGDDDSFFAPSVSDPGLNVSRISGDRNANNRLDTNETWTYEATATVVAGLQCGTATATASTHSASDAGCYIGVPAGPVPVPAISVQPFLDGLSAANAIAAGPSYDPGEVARLDVLGQERRLDPPR